MSSGGQAEVLGEAVVAAREQLDRDLAAAAGDQLELLNPPTRFHGKDAKAQAAKIDRAHAGRGGRPAGSQNKSTMALREYLLARGANPLMQLVRWGMNTPETLAKELGCDKLEAFRELRLLWEGAAPYFDTKLAPTTQDGRPVPQFALYVAGKQVNIGGGLPPWLQDPEVRQALGQEQQNGALLDVSPAKSQGEGSQGSAK